MKYVREIGQGGLGIVAPYLNSRGIDYAVKRIQNTWDGQYYDRFVREIKTMAKLTHQNIIKVPQYNIEINNSYYMIHRYNDGSLRYKMNRLAKAKVAVSRSSNLCSLCVDSSALIFAQKRYNCKRRV